MRAFTALSSALLGLIATLSAASAAPPAQNSTIFGESNPQLAEGAREMQDGHFAAGIRLTQEGLSLPTPPTDLAAAYSNLCAGFAALKQWDEALTHCNHALQLDRSNWRTYNNRAAVFVGQGLYDLAIADVETALGIAPDSATLKKSLQIVLDHKRVNRQRGRTAVKA